MLKILCPVKGEVIISKKIPDETFSKNMMGITLGVIPADKTFVSPITGKLAIAGGHSYCVESPDGVQVFVHIGIDTVKISDEDKARIFKYKVEVGDDVKAGQPILEASLAGIKKCGYSTTTPVFVIRDSVENKDVTYE
ncbi:MAG: PTS glucose transporter subunit IIA [bacterium]|nr:PTS glucose transporter subunit IIA [bacterium]